MQLILFILMVLPNGKLIYTNGQYYANSGYLPNYANIQYQQATLIAKSTTIPTATSFNLNLPSQLVNYPRFMIIISMKLKSGSYRKDLNSLTISNLNWSLKDSNDRVYDSIQYWWGICFKTNTNIGCGTTHKSTSTGTTITLTTDTFLTIESNVSTTDMEIFEVDFLIF